MGVHLGARQARQVARQAGQARNALDAFGYASLTVRVSDGRLMWQTPLARDLLLRYFGTSAPQTPEPVQWLRRHLPEAQARIEPPRLSWDQAAPPDLPPAPADRRQRGRRRLADRDAGGVG
jgi:hypothetical protein